MSEALTESVDKKQVIIVKPSEDDFLTFSDYRQGQTAEQLAAKYDLTPQAINCRLRKVKTFLGPAWEAYVLTDMKQAFPAIKSGFDTLTKLNDSKTINNYLNKMVYPDRSDKGTKIQLNVNNIVGNDSDKQAYDTDVEIVTDE